MRRLPLILILTACRTGIPGASLHGRVVVAAESAAGIVVAAGGPQAARTTTDDNGEYWFLALSPGGYTVTATVASTVEAQRQIEVEADGPVEAPDLVFTPAGELTGRATRGAAQSGNAGILVTVEGTNAFAITDDSGQYHLANVPIGRFAVGAQLAGYRSGQAAGQEVTWAQTTQVPPITLVIGAGHASLHGTALLYGAADHSGIHVVVGATGLETHTAADGTWAIDGVPEGTYAVGFENGFYRETIPAVEALPGSNGFVIDDSLYPLETAPLTLFPTRRIQATLSGSSFLVSPDGSRLLYAESLDGTLRSLPLDGSPAVTLAHRWYNSFGYYDSYAAFSPDNKWVAFQSTDLELVPAAGGQGTHVAWGVGTIRFAPSGGLLGFLGADPDKGSTALFATPYPGAAPKMLVSDAKMTVPIWSADGSHLIYRTNIDDYWRLGTVRIVASSGTGSADVAGGAWDPVVRSDARFALVLGNVSTWDGTATLYSVDLSSGNTVQLGAPVTQYDGFSFAGSDRVVYRSGTTLYSTPIGGGASTTLATGYNFKVSPDGGRVVYGTDCTSYSTPCTAWTVPTAGGTPQMVATGVFDYGFSNDGNQLWFSTDRDNQGVGSLWVTNIGGTPVLIDSTAYSYATQFTPDGSHILYERDVTSDSHGTLNLWGPGGLVTLGHDVEAYGWQVAPDGRHVAFAEKPVAGVRSLWLASLDGSGALGFLDNLIENQFTKQGTLVARRAGSRPPYRFQDGFYIVQP